MDHSLTLDSERCALLVVDVQERINGVMADDRHLPRIAALIEGAAILGVPVLATEQYPKGLGATVAPLAERLPAPPLEKKTFSCAREDRVQRALERLERDQIVITGIETHVCVLQTALDLVERGFTVHVPHDAVNSRRVDDRQWGLHRMNTAGAVVTTTESALFELLGRCGTDAFKAVSKLVKTIPV
jgi:nicotinamidase-related amidase